MMKRFIIAFLTSLLPFFCIGQVVTLSTPTSGEYSSNTVIRLLPGFRTTGNFRAYITGSLNVKLNSVASPSQNYIVDRYYKIPTSTELTDPSVQEVSEVVKYYDGLGRLEQYLMTRGSTQGNDIVQLFEYDQYGREVKKYLPFADQSENGRYRPAAASAQAQFYSNGGFDNYTVKTPVPYSKSIYEASPANRLLEAGAAGIVWQPSATRSNTEGRTVLVNYGTNNGSTAYSTTGFAVRLWVATPVGGSEYKRTLSSTGFYDAGALYLKILKDENWTAADGKAGTTEEYTDKEGRVILKRRFNSEGGSIQVLSTYSVYDELGSISFVLPPGANPDAGSVSQTAQDQFCYQYRYDDRNRLVEKKIPGRGWDYMVYDKLDRLILNQDSVQKVAGQWFFTKYDALGRVVYTGLYANSNSRAAVQSTAEAQAVLWENRISGGIGYTSNAFPQSTAAYHLLNYYDDYDFPGAATYPFNYGSQFTRGRLTGSAVTVLGTSDKLLSVMYYDDHGRVFKVIKQHYQSGAVNTANYDESTNSYSFDGLLTSSHRAHFNNGNITTVASRYEYDHVGRPLRNFLKINNDAEVKLGELVYNEIGLPKRKLLHNGLQQTAYTYNERGWLKTSTSNQFSLQLNYQDGNVPQFNGNVSEQLWGSSAPAGHSFSYGYDKLDRLLSGISSGMSEVISYDLTGNIQTLNRNGIIRSYVYDGNKLSSTSGAAGTGSYHYDGNGNATYDGRNGKAINYNILDLPSAVPALNLTYTYDAAGNKLRKNSNGNITDYVDGIHYVNGQIQFIQTETGIARRNGSSYSYEYDLIDHLGNVRYTFQKNPVSGQLERLQSDDYFPFGLRSSGSPVSLNNKYLYNGKELQEELEQYDYGARFYDPVIGRWNSVDRLAELYADQSGYGYVLNNPIGNIDPNGMQTAPAVGDEDNDPEDPITKKRKKAAEANTLREVVIHGRMNLEDIYYSRLDRGLDPFSGYSRAISVWVWYTNKIGVYNDIKNNEFHRFIYGAAELYAGGEVGGAFLRPLFRYGRGLIGGLGHRGVQVTAGALEREGLQAAADAESYSLYKGVDAAENVRYIGITKRAVDIRWAEHEAAVGTGRDILNYMTVDGGMGLSKETARIMEQNLINQYGLGRNGGQLLNQINSVASKYWPKLGITP